MATELKTLNQLEKENLKSKHFFPKIKSIFAGRNTTEVTNLEKYKIARDIFLQTIIGFGLSWVLLHVGDLENFIWQLDTQNNTLHTTNPIKTLNAEATQLRWDKQANSPDLQPIPSPVSNPELTLESVSEISNEIMQFDNLSLYLDSEGVPVAYYIKVEGLAAADSKIERFTAMEQLQFINTKSLSLEKNGPMVVPIKLADPETSQTIWDQAAPKENSPENPHVEVLPTDVLTAEELATKYGVTIVSNPDSNIQFLIRESAFLEGGVLQPLALLKKAEQAGYTKKLFPSIEIGLDIFLMTEPYHTTSLTNAQLQALPVEVAEIINTRNSLGAIEEHRSKTLAELYAIVTSLGKQLETEFPSLEAINNKINNDLRDKTAWKKTNLERDLLSAKKQLYALSTMSAAEYYSLFPIGIKQKMNYGASVFGEYFGYYRGIKKPVIIKSFQNSDLMIGDQYIFSFSSSGKLEVSRQNPLLDYGFLENLQNIPTVDKSYPTIDPVKPELNDFIIEPGANYQNEYYVLSKNPAGNVMEHESIHAGLIDWLQMLETIDSLEGTNYMGELSWYKDIISEIKQQETVALPDKNEFLTDSIAKKILEKATEKMKNGDDSGYPFIYTIPPNKHSPSGGHMISERQIKEKALFL